MSTHAKGVPKRPCAGKPPQTVCSAIGEGQSEQQIFGEMAYFTSLHARTATVRVGSPEAVILKFQLTPAEFASAPFFGLKRYLGLQAWNRFVSNSQALPFMPGPLTSNSTSRPTPEK